MSEEIMDELEVFDRENKDVFEDWIGSSLYAYNVPYIIDKEKMIEHFHLNEDYFSVVFGIDIDEMRSLNNVSFWLAYHDFFGQPEWQIHYHMHYNNPVRERHNTFNPVITGKDGKELVFTTREEAEKFLIDLLDNITLSVNGYLVKERCEEIFEDIRKQYQRVQFYNDAVIKFSKGKDESK
jgi:hypothetical protein